MALVAPPIGKLARFINAPSLYGGLIGVSLAVVYATLTVDLPEGTLKWLIGITSVLLVLLSWGGDLQERKALSKIIALDKGAAKTRENLQAAVRCAFEFPDKCFWLSLCIWFFGAVLTALVYRMVPGVTWGPVFRIAILGGALGPVVAVFTALLVMRRVRLAVEKIAESGLDPRDVIAAAPPKRQQSRERFIIFTAVSVLTPTLLIADLAITKTGAAFEYVLSLRGNPETQQALADSALNYASVQVVVVAVVLFCLVVGMAWIIGGALAEPMRRMTEEATRIAAGDLSAPKVIAAEDEIWAASAAFTAMHAHLVQLLHQLTSAGLKIGSTTEQLVQTSSHHQNGAEEQAAVLNQTSAATEELARSARQIAENAGSVANGAQKTLAAAQQGQESSQTFSSSMQRVKQMNQDIADAVLRLNKRVQQIGRIVEFINGIADKSDLLALNAELEGTKAGEVGRGFSLVAAEMRRLAESVLRATREIEQLIVEIRDATNSAVMATESGIKATDGAANLAREVSDRLGKIFSFAASTSDQSRAISLATQQQQTGTDQLADTMSDLLRTTDLSQSSARQITSANNDLSQLAHELKAVVSKFRVTP